MLRVPSVWAGDEAGGGKEAAVTAPAEEVYGTVQGKADDKGMRPLPVDVDGLLEYVKTLEEEKVALQFNLAAGKTQPHTEESLDH